MALIRPLADAPDTESVPGERASRAAAPVRTGDVIAGRYDVTGVLGRGAQGVVFRAYDRLTREEIALKTVRHQGLTPARGAGDALAHELRYGRAVFHANVCRVFDLVEDGDRIFLSMQLAGRGSLRDERGTDRPLEERLADARGLLAGLAAVHAAGFVHGDLKPANVLRMSDGRLVVSDFGLTRSQRDGLVERSGGTPGYIAPEVARGERPTVASDIWSLGVVLHELLLARRPSSHGAAACRPRGPATAAHRRVAAVCAACLAPAPARRPESTAEVARRLECACRPSRRWPWLLAALGVAAVAALAAAP